ncbi:hypothetical protein [Streptomyces sp. NPDC020747]|uniref:hypothetical protein n=1 Tax=Streptomyces sp. NPDC020747 TaxID=3365086 RepID=UPI0037A24C14
MGAVTPRGDAVVLGFAVNHLSVGPTSSPLRTIFGVQGTFDDPSPTGLVSGVPCGRVGAQLALGNVAEAAGFRPRGPGPPRRVTDAASYVVTLGALFLGAAQRHRTGRSTGVAS